MEWLFSSASAGSKGEEQSRREGRDMKDRGGERTSRKSGTADKSYPANVARQRELVKPRRVSTGVLKSTIVVEGRERESLLDWLTTAP